MNIAASAQVDTEVWDMEIQPKTGLFDLNLKEVWKYRDLMWLFVRRDFVASFKQTILGPLWHVIQPIMTTIMFLIVFGRIANIPTDGIPSAIFYMSGLTLWNYFSACLSGTSNTFLANSGIFGKVYFPRLVIPISTVLSNLVKLAIQFVLFFAIWTYYQYNGFAITLSWTWLLVPLLTIMMALMGLGIGIIISSLTTKYRDFSILIGFGIQILMYLTPIAYPLSYIDNPKYKMIIQANPLTPIIESLRFALFQTGELDVRGLLYSGVVIVVSLFFGLIIFNRVQKTFMDTV